jgi:hypothetical protein
VAGIILARQPLEPRGEMLQRAQVALGEQDGNEECRQQGDGELGEGGAAQQEKGGKPGQCWESHKQGLAQKRRAAGRKPPSDTRRWKS